MWLPEGLISDATGPARNKYGSSAAISPNIPRAGSLVLTVEDTGAGMTQENVDQLFQEGVQFHANLLQAGGGSGLGLWISKGIVQLHEGLISGSSEGINRGSVFRLELPAFLSEVPMEVERLTDRFVLTAAEEIARMEDSEPIRHILVVDDSVPTRKMVVRLLQNSGYTCSEANDGEAAVEMVMAGGRGGEDGTNSIDLILMDYEMPR